MIICCTLRSDKREGFSLVELSIVLAITGLIIGGVLAGQWLIHASELRSVVTDIDRFRAATNTFRVRYSALPGDMANAYSFWGESCAADALSCNGNGNNDIYSSTVDGFKEYYQAWHHMEIAGLLAGAYTGANDANGNCSFGMNVPSSKIYGAGYIIQVSNFDINRKYYQFGGNTDALYGSCADHAVLPAEDAWNIDSKLDDGRPKTGAVHGEHGGAGVPTVCYTANSEYDLSAQELGCRMFFRM